MKIQAGQGSQGPGAQAMPLPSRLAGFQLFKGGDSLAGKTFRATEAGVAMKVEFAAQQTPDWNLLIHYMTIKIKGTRATIKAVLGHEVPAGDVLEDTSQVSIDATVNLPTHGAGMITLKSPDAIRTFEKHERHNPQGHLTFFHAWEYGTYKDRAGDDVSRIDHVQPQFMKVLGAVVGKVNKGSKAAGRVAEKLQLIQNHLEGSQQQWREALPHNCP